MSLYAAGCLFLTACSPKPATDSAAADIRYENPANWVLLPTEDQPRQPIDVFYVYPTVVAHHDRPLMSWTNEATRDKTENISRQQSSIFSSVANVYAPYCRQLEFYRAWEALTGPDAPDYAPMNRGILDVREAFAFYMEHFNQGRPFILLGHSQGAMDLFFLMKEDFDDPHLATNLVAAYLIGMSIRPEDIQNAPRLRFAQGADDTGVIVTYNTELPDATNSPFANAAAFCINPLNWSTSSVSASRSLNLGAIFFDGQNQITNEVPEFCSARIDPARGAVIVEPSIPGTYDAPDILGTGVTHMNDIYFFYRNLQQNGQVRAAAMSKP